MKKFLSTIILVTLTYWGFLALMPSDYTKDTAPLTEFSTERALAHVKELARSPHYHGSAAHKEAVSYIEKALTDLGLEVSFQEGFSIFKSGELSGSKNILARIKGEGNGDALLLMSHYDSDPHSAKGASDAASGVAAIIESVRAFLAQNITPKNDIIILFTDSEELGLNGASLFANEHPWIKDVKLALNFEARGSGGPSNTLLETNGGNKRMIEEFQEAGVAYPMASSLMYSIYKMLPNDTDSTILREDANVESFFFAFIDDHYDYHTVNDSYENLDRNTLQHQGEYLVPLLKHFATSELDNLKASEDYVYINLPIFKLIAYPFLWVLPMAILALVLLVILIVLGIKRNKLQGVAILKGFIPFLLSMLIGGLLAYFGWPTLKWLYPQYGEILHGFTYNGHDYIAFFSLLSISISFFLYKKFYKKGNTASFAVAPLALWTILNLLFAFYLKGAGFFIIPLYFGLLMLYVLIIQKEPNIVILSLLTAPALWIIPPMIQSFSVGLGLNMLVISAIFTVLLFGLVLAVLNSFQRKKTLGWLFLILSLYYFGKAHFSSDFNSERQKPNSLVYVLDADENEASWATYDNILDNWTKNYITGVPQSEEFIENAIVSKYATRFTYKNKAPLKEIPSMKFEIFNDTVIEDSRHLNLCITPQRPVNRLDLYMDPNFNFQRLKANGVSPKDSEYRGAAYNVFTKRWRSRLLTYHLNENTPLDLKMRFHKDSIPTIIIYESSYDLLESSLFTIPERTLEMIPKPFVVNDAIIVKKSYTLPPKPVVVVVDSLSNTNNDQ
ncbi:M20/M25/M40 family metallo-hydrolase [Sungkyunkwania multivorans]|uniref:Vacuolar membrane protease n=1 Tax=Sungkyunkwania multivorans TaxID=1173618 RepID=A0ABW3CYU8_9FLAO